MGRLNSYQRNRIVVLMHHYSKSKDLLKALERENIEVSRQSLYNLIRKVRTCGSIADLRREGRIPILQLEHLDYIDNCMVENPETSARDLQIKLVTHHDVNVSISTIKRVRNKLGWVYTSSRYCQMVRHVNMPLRTAFCLECLGINDTFHNVIFSDECSVKLGNSLTKCFRRKHERRLLIGKPKHPLKVHVWAGISWRGPTPICIFQGNMDGQFYRHILENYLLPFIREIYPDNHRFQQDNDPKHTANATMDWFHENAVNLWPTPAESPDLNPIENLWAGLKRYIRKTVKPSNQDELVNGILDFWKTVTPRMCQNYIQHIQKVMPVVIAREGGPSGY